MTEEEYQKMLLLGLSFGGALVAASSYFYKIHFLRFNTALDIPRSYLKTKTLTGKVLKVADGDNFRLYHCPNLRPSWLINRELQRIKNQSSSTSEKSITPIYKLSERTINVRLYGIDAPEIGHFGNKTQEFAIEAKNYLQKLVLGKKVTILPLKVDMYNRIVAVASVKKFWFFNRDISAEMIKAGMAQMYEGQDLVHHTGMESLIAAEKVAKVKKIGIWSQSKKKYESPREYKKKVRERL